MPQTREEYNAYMAAYMKDRIARRHAKAIRQFGGKCVRCGSTEHLEFDHPNRDPDPRGRRNRGTMWTFSEERLQAELAKCQLLCHDCHREKTVRCGETGGGQNRIPDEEYFHGTARMYLYRTCRCPPCKYARSLYRQKLVTISEVVRCENTTEPKDCAPVA